MTIETPRRSQTGHDQNSSSQTASVASHQDLIAYALRWIDHGGGPAAEIFTRFSMSPQEYFTALATHLESDPPAPVHPAVIDRMKRVARKRLWLVS
jgi:hypothetical protein